MSRAILITRPDHDLITTYLFHWSKFVLQEASKKGIKVLDLSGKKANSKTFISYIKKHQPILVFFNGHGSEDVITGYEKKYALAYTPSKVTTPLKDEIAKLFIEPSNLIPNSLLKGNTAKDAYRKSQDSMWRNFRFMLSTRASESQKDAAPYLWFNRKYQVVLGDQDAHL